MNIELLKKAKKEKKLSYDELAKQTGLSRRAICSLFSGETENPRIDTMQAIERALGLAPAFTEEELARGVTNGPTALSDRDLNSLTILNRAEEVLGVEYVNAILNAVEVSVEQKLKEKK